MKMMLETRVAALVAREIVNGADPIDALRNVCGEHVVDKMITELYDELRAKRVAKK